MKLLIEIDLDNDAFREPGELYRLTQEIARRLEADVVHEHQNAITLQDRNGNTCGSSSIIEAGGTYQELADALRLMLDANAYADGEGMVYFKDSDTEDGKAAVAAARRALAIAEAKP